MGLRSAFATVGLGAIACAAFVLPLAPTDVKAAESRPNIVVLYMDDVNPHERDLWCSARAPELSTFCSQGVEFRNAFGSTPLCGPSRANLLTGQYSHNNGVTDNSLESFRQFDPDSTLATKLQGVGYHTIFDGKPINSIGLATDSPGVSRYTKGWNDFGLIWKRAGRYLSFYDYHWWARYKILWKGHRPDDHSTKVIGRRVANQIRSAPQGKPVFAMVSLFSGHTPNIAMANHVGSPKCSRVKPWKGKSYNEWDVSDKPDYIQALPRLKANAFSLRKRCEEILSVDWVLKEIRQALRDGKRLNNTLIVFTADNGLLMGDHRKPAGKRWPHATPIPMYMVWPKELHGQRRVVTEPVSDVDLAPTFCKLAGCQLDAPDGQGLLPLLRGSADRLDRGFIYTEHLHPSGGMPPWYGLVTSKAYSTSATWQYVEYGSGERELYNLTQDPFRLRNAANYPGQQDRVRELHDRLHNKVIGPDDVQFR